jgi:hypothetical protein
LHEVFEVSLFDGKLELLRKALDLPLELRPDANGDYHPRACTPRSAPKVFLNDRVALNLLWQRKRRQRNCVKNDELLLHIESLERLAFDHKAEFDKWSIDFARRPCETRLALAVTRAQSALGPTVVAINGTTRLNPVAAIARPFHHTIHVKKVGLLAR